MIARKSGRKPAEAAECGALLRAFQDALEALRLEGGLSRRAFAERLGIPRSSYFLLMTPAANPSLRYIELIAVRAGVDPINFLGKIAATEGFRRSAPQHAQPLS